MLNFGPVGLTAEQLLAQAKRQGQPLVDQNVGEIGPSESPMPQAGWQKAMPNVQTPEELQAGVPLPPSAVPPGLALPPPMQMTPQYDSDGIGSFSSASDQPNRSAKAARLPMPGDPVYTPPAQPGDNISPMSSALASMNVANMGQPAQPSPAAAQAGAAAASPAAAAAQPSPQQQSADQARAQLRQLSRILMMSTSPAERAQGIQMLFESQQPTAAEKEAAERQRLSDVVDASNADDETKSNAKTMVGLGAKAEDVSKALGYIGERPVQNRAQQAVDTKYAAQYADFMTGGRAQSAADLNQLQAAHDVLKDNSHTFGVTGAIGYVPDAYKTLFGAAGERALSTKQAVEQVVQNSLKAVLGSAFTAKEGEALLARTYNDKATPETNAMKVGSLIERLQNAYKDKLAAADYFQKNDTLKGFPGRADYAIADFEPNLLHSTPRADNTQKVVESTPRPAGMSDNQILALAANSLKSGTNRNAIEAQLKAWGVQY